MLFETYYSNENVVVIAGILLDTAVVVRTLEPFKTNTQAQPLSRGRGEGEDVDAFVLVLDGCWGFGVEDDPFAAVVVEPGDFELFAGFFESDGLLIDFDIGPCDDGPSDGALGALDFVG